jgi:hypothetical protein
MLEDHDHILWVETLPAGNLSSKTRFALLPSWLSAPIRNARQGG